MLGFLYLQALTWLLCHPSNDKNWKHINLARNTSYLAYV